MNRIAPGMMVVDPPDPEMPVIPHHWISERVTLLTPPTLRPDILDRMRTEATLEMDRLRPFKRPYPPPQVETD